MLSMSQCMLCCTLATDDDDDDDNDVSDSEYIPGPDVSKQRKKCMFFYHLKCILEFLGNVMLARRW